MGDPQPQWSQQYVGQSGLVGRTFVWQYQLQLGGLHWHEFQSRLGSTDLLSDPTLVLQPSDQLQPAQLAIQWNIINQTWPHIGSFTVQTMLQGGLQWTDSQGSAVTLQAGLDISNSHIDWLHLQGGFQLTFSEGPAGGLHADVEVPVSTVSALVRW
jgi:hypothetical protein